MIYFSKIFLFLFIGILYPTFSIVAVDTNTGEVGSAGGSCIGNSIIISDIHPGIGVIHTQSYWLSANQNNASDMMHNGYSPQEIMDYLEFNDVQNNSSIRQYGAVDIYSEFEYGQLLESECLDIGNSQWLGTSETNNLGECISIPISRSASFTGNNCSEWKGHINGINYAIQGNILLDSSILESMESHFVDNNGTLDQKLMSSLQGAKVPGSDTRCLDEGISTLSAFIRVAKPDDLNNNLYMDLNVASVVPYYSQNGTWIDPIDTLQSLYNEWYDENFNFNHGDINQDSIIDILDVVTLVNFVLYGFDEGITFYLSDINADNTINIQDIILIINLILD